jgi:hypothetical protein
MLILNPREVTFGAAAWPNVTLLSIDRTATRLALNWSDSGPHPTFADAPEQRTDIKVLIEVDRDEGTTPRPGDQATLSFVTSPTASDATRRCVSTAAVVTAVNHELSLKRGAIRTIDLVAISPDGTTDPLSIQDTA